MALPALLTAAGFAPPEREQALAGLRLRLAPWLTDGLLLEDGPRWRLADPAGLALSNGVLRELLNWWSERAAAGRRSSGAAPPPPEHAQVAGAG